MNIIGISGFQWSMPFKRAHWPGLNVREYRMSQGHDSAAALVVNGEIVAAAAEERFTGQKQTGAFPVNAIRFCLKEANLSTADVHELAHAFDYTRYRRLLAFDDLSRQRYNDVYSREALIALVSENFPEYSPDRVIQVEHHDAHAASAYYTSGWDDCLVVVTDGMGEAHSVTVFEARAGQLRSLGRISAHDSIGILYSLVTYHLGFDFNSDEYKIMGLAPYGDPAPYRSFFQSAIELLPDGTLRIPILRLNETRDERENYLATRAYLAANLIPERQPEEEITQAHRDVAAALQECLDNVMLHVCGTFGRQTGMKRLALAGGVALNCTANGKLMQSGLFDDIYVQAAAGDDGSALGAALHRTAVHGPLPNKRMAVPFFGPCYGPDSVGAAVAAFGDRICIEQLGSFDETCARAAALIAEGRVLAWYRGRMEFGPRALGNRSILADPGHPEMRDRINAMVKKREAFRPFAPAVSLEEVHRWFDVAPGTELPYMIMIVDVRPEHRDTLPAITHVNGSARVQTVSARGNRDFHTLLKHVGKTTGREMVLNTSFNVKGQPIVNTPHQAIETFLGTGIDCLFLENVFVRRR
jgi:carbamoyltransferase